MILMIPVAACSSPHNPMKPNSSERVTPVAGGTAGVQGHARKVLITDGGLPAEAKYQILAQIDVGRA
jgi:hypothetical protein